ncbi:probable polygalacturonase At3g15720 [Macadamia integrifolia]|uniref:probable polygalacturonase At3g15720 n=1 Tax=Macadamia integrifolia TaxID=60698 RepID=UPI001C52BDF3|nr:probable polygalacturonase At3g15720 [Macadamia integrifolia]
MQDLISLILLFYKASTIWNIGSDVGKTDPTIVNPTFNVLDYKAIGDGIKDDSNAFMEAWEAVCRVDTSATPTLIIPSGKTFLLKPIEFHGPCNASNIYVQVLGNIVAPNDISEYIKDDEIDDKWLGFSNITGLVIDGFGLINGQGSIWWAPNTCKNAKALRFHKCNGLRLSGLRHVNSQKNHISIFQCNDVIISGLHITAPEESPNTDGIDISQSSHIQIKDSFIGTGDDCVAINGGSSFINITNITCGPGHGISVGSLGADGNNESVEGVNVQNCNFSRTTNGLRIKTWQGGSGFARNISFQQINLKAVANPIIIDQFYCNSGHGCKIQASAVKVSNVTFKGVQGTSITDKAIQLSCSKTVGCSDILLNQINITSTVGGKKTNSSCSNAQGKCINCYPPVTCLE